MSLLLWRESALLILLLVCLFSATVFGAFALLDSGRLPPCFYPPGSAFPTVYKLLLPRGLKTFFEVSFFHPNALSSTFLGPFAIQE